MVGKNGLGGRRSFFCYRVCLLLLLCVIYDGFGVDGGFGFLESSVGGIESGVIGSVFVNLLSLFVGWCVGLVGRSVHFYGIYLICFFLFFKFFFN